MKALYELTKDRLEGGTQADILWRDEIVEKLADFQEEDELLSSRMLRLALANYTSAFRLANGILGEPEGSWETRDVDRSATPRLVEKLSERTGRPVEDVFRLTLRGRYEGRLYIGHRKIGHRKTGFLRWILPGGLRGGRRSHHGLLYCPLCLRDAPPNPTFGRGGVCRSPASARGTVYASWAGAPAAEGRPSRTAPTWACASEGAATRSAP